MAFAKDAITWAARSAAKGGTNAPASLTTAQLKAIFSCTATNWAQVGGKNGAIKVYLPQAGSELSPPGRSSWASRPSALRQPGARGERGHHAGFNNPNAIFI